jgi:predicted patatin/cPLA2 family phospholipase
MIPVLAEFAQAPKRSLILSGGGMRVAYQAGVLQALFEAGLRFNHADGTSGGSINLAMLFSGLSTQQMIANWRTLDPKQFIGLMPLDDYLKPAQLPALSSADGVTGKVFPHLGIDIATINAATGMQGSFNLCNFSSKTLATIEHADLTLEMLVAGISLPMFMPAVERNGAFYTDAAWIKDANLLGAVERGASQIWLVWCIGNSAKYYDGAFRQYVHMMEMAANGALFAELAQIAAINARIAAGEAVGGRSAPIVLHVIRPATPLPLDPDYVFGRIDGATLISLGYNDAKTYLAGCSPAGLPLTPGVTKMNEETPSLSFREVMTGGFALGTAEPEAGLVKGKREGTTLALHATVLIQDFDRFLSDPEHLGTLAGFIEFAPFGGSLTGYAGVFNLFNPSGQPGLKLMVYELGFEVAGKPYYLAGQKEVRQGSALTMWHQTTTLYTKLHEGRDKTGPVAGAGILSLGVTDLAKMVSTLQVSGVASAAEKPKILGRFGAFFLDELWDSYKPHLGI